MTQQDYTALVFVVDRSGSMSGIAKDMEGGIRTIIDQQKALPGKVTVDFVRFDTEIEHLHKFANPNAVNVRINPRGGTALNDAVGQTIDHFGEALAALPEELRPEKVIFAIVTDGYENSSRRYTAALVKEKVQHQTEKYDWNFTYLGANQDALFVARQLGIHDGAALTWNTHDVYAATSTLNNYVTGTRSMVAGASYSYTDADRKNNA